MGPRDFDPEKIKEFGDRKLCYETDNGVWWVQAGLHQLPGGQFTGVEAWRQDDKFELIRYASWTYGSTDDGPAQYAYTKKRWGDLPAYVIKIGEELATILKRKFPLRGISFASMHGRAIDPIRR